MNNYELNRKKYANEFFLNTVIEAKNKLEKTHTVQKYLKLLEYIEKNKKFQNYLNSLEVGIDGTIFAPYDELSTNDFKKTHFGLSKLLIYAFDLLYRSELENGKLSDFYQISFDDFDNYVKNAECVLTKMCFVDGDRTIEDKYGFSTIENIYENPKNYSVVDLADVLPMNYDRLKRDYCVDGVTVGNMCFVATEVPISVLSVDCDKLTPREREAFYGEGAKKALGITNVKVKKKMR